jgi:hypothetical protein
MLTTILQQLSRVLTWWVIVAPWEQALRVRFGKKVARLDAGIYFNIPFIDKVYKQSVRRRLNVIRPQTLTTLDRHVITYCGAIGYSVEDLEKLYDTLEAPNDTIENEVCGIIARFIATHNLRECSSKEIESEVMAMLDLKKYGLAGQEFYMTSFATCKTYRFITGQMDNWQRDSQLNMAENKSNSLPY